MQVISGLDDEFLLDGEYLITDPCYVIDDNDWTEFLNLLYSWSRVAQVITIIEYRGIKLYVMPTAHGDGEYGVVDQLGIERNTFGVDSGMFAFIPAELNDDTQLGPVVKFKGVLSYERGNAYIDNKKVVDTYG